ncbi:MAG: hypothetical protein J6Q92_05265 [Oscillospiraceae bacterium]|nr:hypothetical protein [Oscillospiraceae bacterium]
MKQVSGAYKESMAKPFRNRSYVRVLFSNSDTTILTDGEWVGNGELAMSETSTLDYNLQYGNPYATLELNRWVLDGSFDIAPEQDAVTGFVSSIMSDEGGDMPTAATITRSFSKTHTIPTLTLAFDTRTGIHPNSVTADFYLSGSIVKSLTVPVTSDTVAIATDVSLCDKIVITYGQMPPYRHPRLESVSYGDQKVFTDEEIASTKQSHDIDPLSRRLPKETMQFTILDFEHQYDPDNPSGIWKYVAEKSAIGIQFGYKLPDGNTEWVKADHYILDSRPSFANNQATFKATGSVGRLAGTYYKGTIGEKSFYDLATDILTDADLPPLPDGSNPWIIDDSLKTMYTTAPLPIDTHANCLQMIAHACRCVFRTDDDDIIRIEPFTVTAETEVGDFSIDFSSIHQNTQTMTKIDQLKAVSVAKYSYTKAAQTEIYSETTTDTIVHVEFSSATADVGIAVSGGYVVSSKVYAQAADLVLSAGTKTITITGRPLSQQATVYTLDVGSQGSVDEERNPLITDLNMAKELATHVAAYLQQRNTYDVSYRGNPELECGDIIGLETMYSPVVKGLVLTDEITYNGALRGKVKVKALAVIMGVLDAFILDESVLD